jgi:hypothetical protein
MDAFPDERDDNEFLFFSEEDAESRCLFLRSPAIIDVSTPFSYNLKLFNKNFLKNFH